MLVKARIARLNAVKKIIETNTIRSQDALLELIQKEGFSLTQATLSRDLRSLQVSKRYDSNNGYIYSLPDEAQRKEHERTHIEDFMRGYVSIEWSGVMVVIKTYSGHAGSVALAVDDLALDDVMGTIAGDNTVFVCLREGKTGEDFMAIMKKNIPELEA
jgi:transcriptional regulator of arginine metabolism